MTSRAVTAAGLLLLSLLSPAFDSLRGNRFGIGPVEAFAAQKTAAQLEAEFGKESNPKKRIKLAVDITDERLKQLLAAYETEDSAKEAEALETYLTALDRLEKVLAGNLSGGAPKDVEIRLRQQIKSLTNLRMSVAFAEQSAVGKALERVTKLHETVLYSIMKPKKKR